MWQETAGRKTRAQKLVEKARREQLAERRRKMSATERRSVAARKEKVAGRGKVTESGSADGSIGERRVRFADGTVFN